MQSFKNFVKRNAPVFIFGLVVALVFLLIILAQPNDDKTTPAGFRRVEDEMFKREPTEPTPEPKPVEYAPQTASPDNVGKPYFYGEANPNLRDPEGYPTNPSIETVLIPESYSKEKASGVKDIALEKITERNNPRVISFTETGFSPENSTAYTGRLIAWKNESNKEITVIETVPKHVALKGGIKIKPGESFSFKPLLDRMLVYMELETGKYGSILIKDITSPLLEGL